MDGCTHSVRAQYWEKVIEACHQRPAGQSAKAWMEENEVCEQSYYYWQRRLRQKMYQQLQSVNTKVPTVVEHSEISFAEIPFQQENFMGTKECEKCNTPAAILRTGILTIAITNDISDDLLARIIREVSHA